MDETQSTLRDLFNRALEIEDTQQRAVYLAQACANDGTLRRKLDQLLDWHEKAGGFLGGCDGPTAGADEEIGSLIGRYKLLQKVGEGGCGVVYMAEQGEPVRRRLALKVIKLGMDTKQVIARFEAERQALAMMDHPNIAKVFDAGMTETGRPYFVMELVRGLKITQYCDEARLSTEQRLGLFIQVCEAVQHAHQKGIIHRDIKPSNVLVTVNDGVAVPKVIDFGIAKAITGQPLTDKTIFTAFEQFVGTPAYMSPEQALMTSLDTDTRSDIYGLGVLLYELLAGRTPFDAKQLLAAGLEEMCRTIREREPQRPSTCLSTLAGNELSTTAQRRAIEPPKLISQLRGDLDWIVMKCLEKDRARRYETINALARDLERYLNTEPITARPPSSVYRFQKLVRRNKLAFAAGGAVLGALLIGLALSSWLFLREREERRRAVLAEKTQRQLRQRAETERQNAMTAAQKSRQLAQFLQDMLRRVGPSAAQGRDTTLLKEILDETAERVGRDLTNQPEVEVELRTTLARTYLELGLYEPASKIAQQAVQVARSRLGKQNIALSSALDVLAWAQFFLGHSEQAEKCVREALAIARELVGNEDPNVAEALDTLAFALMNRKGREQEMEDAANEALALRRKLLGPEHPLTAKSLQTMANVLMKAHRDREAEPYAREALTLDRKIMGNQHYDTLFAISKLGNILMQLGELTEAEALERECVAIERKLLSKEHPALASDLSSLGNILAQQQKNQEAEAMLREALQLRRKQLYGNGALRLDVAQSLNLLGGVLERLGKLDEAETMLQEALAIEEKCQGDERTMLADSLNNLANVLEDQVKLEEAENMHRRALAIQRELLGNEHRDVATSLNNLAGVLERRGTLDQAETMHREALAIRRKAPGNDHAEVADSLDALGRLVVNKGGYAEAESMLREAVIIRRNSLITNLPALGASLFHLAIVLEREDKFSEAEQMLRQALDIAQKCFGENHQNTAHVLATLGNVLRHEGNLSEAEGMQRLALETLRRLLGNEHPDVKMGLDNLAITLMEQNKFSDAEKLYSDFLSLPINEQTNTAQLLKSRGELFARTTKWKEATADLSRALELNPGDSVVWHSLAALLAQRGDLEAYRGHCRKSLERFGNTTNPPVAERISKDCLLLPSSGTGLDAVARLAEVAVSAPPSDSLTYWSYLCKGLAEYRRGDFVFAMDWTQRASAASEARQIWELYVQAQMVLAMAQHRLKQGSEARASLARGLKVAAEKLAKLESGDLGALVPARDWIGANVLMREAKELIEDNKAPSAQPTAEPGRPDFQNEKAQTAHQSLP